MNVVLIDVWSNSQLTSCRHGFVSNNSIDCIHIISYAGLLVFVCLFASLHAYDDADDDDDYDINDMFCLLLNMRLVVS